MAAAAQAGPVIRVATADDVDDIHALLVELALALGAPEKVRSTPADLLRAGFGEHREFEALLAVHESRCVGLALYFYEFSSWRGETGVYVQDIVVTTPYRGTGLAQRLMRATATEAQQRGATYLRLSVDANNVSAMRFYRAIGLEPAANERIFFAAGTTFKNLTGES